MLYLVGLGLGDAKDITVKGLEIVRRARLVFLEAYTSILGVGKEALVSRLLYRVVVFVRLLTVCYSQIMALIKSNIFLFNYILSWEVQH